MGHIHRFSLYVFLLSHLMLYLVSVPLIWTSIALREIITVVHGALRLLLRTSGKSVQDLSVADMFLKI